MDYVFILAGGKGTRLWPASDSRRPKQFIPLVKGKSLFQLSVLRAAALKPAKGIIVISLAEQKELVRDDLAALGSLDVPVCMIPEPYGRNTAPAITAAVLYAAKQSGGSSTAIVLTSDHLIRPNEAFAADSAKAEKLAAEGYIATFGIKPLRPETGYGYIEAGESVRDGYKVHKFHEKPDSEKAEKYLASGNFYWNSGMFAFSLDTYISETEKQAAAIADAFKPCGFDKEHKDSGFSVILEGQTFDECYKRMPSVSVDYAIMEKCSRAAVVEASFDWNDLGSWDEIATRLPDSLDQGLVIPENSKNFIYSDIPVSVHGLDDIIVVIKNGRCLVCRKGSSQDVKKTVEELKEKGLKDLL